MPPNKIVSASRDCSIFVWGPNPSGKGYSIVKTLKGHSNFVGSLACLKPSEAYPEGLIVSGSMDKTIMVWDPSISGKDHEELSEKDALYTLVGHSDNVCTLDVWEDTVVSGSWDKTARVWKHFQNTVVLEGHEQAVWSVKFVKSESKVLTAAADKFIRLFIDGKCTRKFSGHEDVVRSLALDPTNPENSFYSAGNDGCIKKWNMEYENSQSDMYGHTSFIYAISPLSALSVVSSGEDKSCRIWENGSCKQTILHPAQSVWCVTALPNGDIVTGSNDSIIRVFTKDPSRLASEDELKIYEEEISKSTVHKGQVGDLNKEKVPDISALENPGSKDQEVKMVKNGSVIEAHQWNQSSNKWLKLGEVVDAVGSSRKQTFQGKEYDYVFDVDIADGAPPLKLPYNVNENPYLSAQKFIDKNELPQSYLDQVAEFIIKNTEGASLEIGSHNGAVADPYTGGTRYVPHASSMNTSSGSTKSNLDPYTGYNASSVNSTLSKKICPLSVDSYLCFESGNLLAIQKKLFELSGDKLTSSERRSVEKMVQFCQNPEAAMSKFTNEEFSVLHRLLFEYSNQESCFPILDLIRRLALVADIDSFSQNSFRIVGEKLFESKFNPGLEAAPLEGSPVLVNQMLIMRIVSNALKFGGDTRQNILDERKTFLDALKLLVERIIALHKLSLDTKHRKSLNNCLTACVTAMLNLSISFIWHIEDGQSALELLEIISYLIATQISESALPLGDTECIYRLLVAIGNLVFKYPELKQACKLIGIDESMKKNLNSGAAWFSSDRRISHFVSGELSRLLQ